jgi:hypothetical protein
MVLGFEADLLVFQQILALSKKQKLQAQERPRAELVYTEGLTIRVA